jgi:hypothetical protein
MGGHAIIIDPDGHYRVHPLPGSDPNWRGHKHHRQRAGP